MNNVGIYVRDGPFESDISIVNLHQSKGSHWVAYIDENNFDSYGCVSPEIFFKLIIERNGPSLYSENEVQGLTNKRDSYCAICCLYIIYLRKVLGNDPKSDVLNLYYQMI